MRDPIFPGVRKPTTDFLAVRSDLQTGVLSLDVDLSSARSIAATTELELPIAGNSIYIDQDPSVGNASLIVQDDARGARPTRIFVQPGFIAQLPFTRLIIENTAQAGKILRVHYGVDIDFRPGMSATVSGGVSITAPLRDANVAVTEAGATPGAFYKSTTALALNTPDTIFTPAANTNGAILWACGFWTYNATGAATRSAYLAKASAPTTVIDGDIELITERSQYIGGAYWSSYASRHRATRIAAGKGLYFITDQTEGIAYRFANYTLL